MKHRITIALEISVDPDRYGVGRTDEEKLALDMEGISRNPEDYVNAWGVSTTISGELIKDE